MSDMHRDTPVFEIIHRPSNHTYKIYSNGLSEGFPEDSFILNRIHLDTDQFIGKLRSLGNKDVDLMIKEYLEKRI